MVDLKNYDVVDGRWEPIVGSIASFVAFSLAAWFLRVMVPSVKITQIRAWDLFNTISVHPEAVGLIIDLSGLLEYSVGPALGVAIGSILIGQTNDVWSRASAAGIGALALTYAIRILGGLDIVFAGSVATIAAFLAVYYRD